MHTDTASIFLLIYVDDMIITKSSPLAVNHLIFALNHLIFALNQSFPVKNLGRPGSFLDIKLDYLFDGVIIGIELDYNKSICWIC